MKRDMMKTVEKNCGNGIIPVAYDMDFGEMKELYNMAVPSSLRGVVPTDGVLDAIQAAFVYGFVLGSRAERKNAIGKKI